MYKNSVMESSRIAEVVIRIADKQLCLVSRATPMRRPSSSWHRTSLNYKERKRVSGGVGEKKSELKSKTIELYVTRKAR